MKVLIVDDSVTFRSAIKAALSGVGEVESTVAAANGKIAIAKLENEPFDMMILDLEMPEMDGIETLTALKSRQIAVRTLIFASPTEQNYKKVSMALKLGADDFLAKPSGTAAAGNVEAAIESIRAEIVPRLKLLGQRGKSDAPAPQALPEETPKVSKRELGTFRPAAVVIASSTGGPVALEHVFSEVPPVIRVPIFIVQHMPPPFTKGLAKKLQEITQVPAAEGVDGEVVTNRIYLAPADLHMSVRQDGALLRLVVFEGPKINYVRPAADPLFSAVAPIYGKSLMAFILTGMGEDGLKGVLDVKRFGGGVMIQDEESSVVWGMPGAVFNAGAYDQIGSLDNCAQVLKRMVS